MCYAGISEVLAEEKNFFSSQLGNLGVKKEKERFGKFSQGSMPQVELRSPFVNKASPGDSEYPGVDVGQPPRKGEATIFSPPF